MSISSILLPLAYDSSDLQEPPTWLNVHLNNLRVSNEYVEGDLTVVGNIKDANGFRPQVVYTADVVVTAAALATGGQVLLQASSGSQQFKVINAYGLINTAFSGGGGDRNVLITDGTASYGTLNGSAFLTNVGTAGAYNGNGDSDGIDLPTANTVSTRTQPGASLFATYTGGTTDWAAGSVTLSLVLLQIA